MVSDRVIELANIAKDNNYITYTDYLTPNEYKEIGDKYKGLTVKYNGKLRKMIAFVPEYQEDYIEFPETLIKIEVKNNFKEYSNKDFLGSIMSLNIDRKYLGDIFVIDNTAYVYVSNKILNILLNLKKVAKNECNISICNYNIDLDFKYELQKYTVSSIRLDNIVSKICNVSRTKAKEFIELGVIKVDYSICLDSSKILKENCILSVKSYGRFIYNGIKKETKKSKLVIELNKFV